MFLFAARKKRGVQVFPLQLDFKQAWKSLKKKHETVIPRTRMGRVVKGKKRPSISAYKKSSDTITRDHVDMALRRINGRRLTQA